VPEALGEKKTHGVKEGKPVGLEHYQVGENLIVTWPLRAERKEEQESFQALAGAFFQ
jgi:hypothetical protein